MAHTHKYDVVVIGGGLGGLLSAVLLAKEGMKVCVLEQNKQIGGCLQTFSLHKKVFESCVHYIGGLGEGHTLNTIFRYAGIMDKLQLKELDNTGFDRISFAGNEKLYPIACGHQNFEEQLAPYFPAEREEIKKYLRLIQKIADHFPLYNLQNGDATTKEAVSDWQLSSVIQDLTTNTTLQNVLLGNSMLYAGDISVTPFYMHALVTGSYMHSTHKIVPGSSEISKLLWKELQQHGGTIYRNDAVVKVTETNGKIEHAETASGERYYGKTFIAAIHPAQFLNLTDSKFLKPIYRKRIAGLPQTLSVYTTNLVLKPGSVPYRNYNRYHHNYNAPGCTLLPQSVENSLALYFAEDTGMPGYAATLSILSYMDFSRFRQWQDTYNSTAKPAERDNGYQELKEQLEQEHIAKATELFPELEGNIVAVSSSSPLTLRDYTGTPEGALYGVIKNVHNAAITTIPARTGIPNLFLTGQNINLHGVLGVGITAVSTCAEMLGMDYLLRKIRNA